MFSRVCDGELVEFKYSAHFLYLEQNINIIQLDLTLGIVTSA